MAFHSQSSKKRGNGLRMIGVFSALLTQFVAIVASGVFVGNWSDHQLHTSPWLLLVGILLGIATGIVTTYRLSKVWLQ
ncbi:MAG: AtpZ/AtpI family protein [Firmicutes bacterium]|nr:AtpZ/AtpI family protein [Bacillota bacterium]